MVTTSTTSMTEPNAIHRRSSERSPWARESSCPEGHASWNATGRRWSRSNRAMRARFSTPAAGGRMKYRRRPMNAASARPSTVSRPAARHTSARESGEEGRASTVCVNTVSTSRWMTCGMARATRPAAVAEASPSTQRARTPSRYGAIPPRASRRDEAAGEVARVTGPHCTRGLGRDRRLSPVGPGPAPRPRAGTRTARARTERSPGRPTPRGGRSAPRPSTSRPRRPGGGAGRSW